jgi:hypothetical protein
LAFICDENARLRSRLPKGVPHMPDYRAYIIGPDGRVQGRVDLTSCQDDDAAREHAAQLVDGHDIELWDGGRKIETLPHKQ